MLIIPARRVQQVLDSRAAYQLRNWRRALTALKTEMGVEVARRCGVATIHGRLYAQVCRRVGDSPWNGGELYNLGLLSTRVITDAGVAFLVDDWAGATTDIGNFNYHDSGTGTTAEAVGQTALVTQAGPTTRATGTLSQPSANIVQSVGTISYTSTLAITEHGLFDQAAQGGSMWDRSLFSAINVVNGDSIQFTYQATFTSGG